MFRPPSLDLKFAVGLRSVIRFLRVVAVNNFPRQIGKFPPPRIPGDHRNSRRELRIRFRTPYRSASVEKFGSAVRRYRDVLLSRRVQAGGLHPPSPSMRDKKSLLPPGYAAEIHAEFVRTLPCAFQTRFCWCLRTCQKGPSRKNDLS